VRKRSAFFSLMTHAYALRLSGAFSLFGPHKYF
jgi:hypothetical protein